MWNRKKTQIYDSSGCRTLSDYQKKSGTLSSFSPNASVFGRNLRKDQLGGVIFGCKNHTMKECLSKQLFGLPAQHFSYVKNIEPGMPLFLFNYSDRKLHGVFEAASKGKLSIDRYGWTDGSEATQFPAQVQVCVQSRCQPLPEEKFRPAIADNYYMLNHFWFELDHGQANKLISLLKQKPLSITPGNGVPQNTKWITAFPSLPSHNPWGGREAFKMPESELEHYSTKWVTASPSLPSDDPWGEDEAFKMPESELEHYSTHSSMISGSSENDFSLNGHIQPLDTHTIDMEKENQDEKHLIFMKLKELAVPRETQDLSWEDDVSDTLDRNNTCSEGKNSKTPVGSEKQENPSSPLAQDEKQDEKHLIFMKLKELAVSRETQDLSWEDNVSDTPDANNTCPEGKNSETPIGSEKQENPSSPFECQYSIAQLVQEVKELTNFKATQTERNNYLEQKLMEAELEIQHLKDRCALLESTCNIPVTHVEETVTNPSAELHLDPTDSLFLIGGSDGQSLLATMDLYCTSQNVIKSLKPMSSARLYASAVELNGEIYVFGGGDDYVWYDKVESYNPVLDDWTLRPSLNQKKGSLSGAALNGKIFAVGGGNGVDCFSDVEMLDLDIGRWIPTRSMLDKRFALAAVELNGVIYATGGFDGNNYLNSAERFDPREHSWTKMPSMNIKRGCHSLVVLNEKLYALGGFNGDTMVPSVEVFDPRLGKWMMAEKMNHPRGYSAAAVINESIYVIGGVNVGQTIVDTVENYKEGQGWEEIYTSADVKRCFLSAIVCSHE